MPDIAESGGEKEQLKPLMPDITDPAPGKKRAKPSGPGGADSDERDAPKANPLMPDIG